MPSSLFSPFDYFVVGLLDFSSSLGTFSKKQDYFSSFVRSWVVFFLLGFVGVFILVGWLPSIDRKHVVSQRSKLVSSCNWEMLGSWGFMLLEEDQEGSKVGLHLGMLRLAGQRSSWSRSFFNRGLRLGQVYGMWHSIKVYGAMSWAGEPSACPWFFCRSIFLLFYLTLCNNLSLYISVILSGLLLAHTLS